MEKRMEMKMAQARSVLTEEELAARMANAADPVAEYETERARVDGEIEMAENRLSDLRAQERQLQVEVYDAQVRLDDLHDERFQLTGRE